MPSASLTRLDPTDGPRAVALLLHGGKARSTQPVDGRSASWRRMATMQRALAPGLHEAGVAAWLLRYQWRGWNGGAPVVDARWALDEVRAAFGDIPVVLVGHSMGARTSVHVADDPSVVGVVGLAPWWGREDPAHTLRGKHLRAAHGHADRITSARMTAAYVARAQGVARSATFTDMGPVGHYMFRRVSAWNRVAREQTLAVLR